MLPDVLLGSLGGRVELQRLLVPPWLLALGVLGVGVSRGQRRSARWALRITLSACATCALALLLHLLTDHAQANGQELAALLPLWLGASFAAFQASVPASVTPSLTARVAVRD